MKFQSQLWSPSTLSVSQNLKREQVTVSRPEKPGITYSLDSQTRGSTSTQWFLVYHSWQNWNLDTLVFVKRGKPEYREKNLLEQRRGPTTSLTIIWRRHWDLKSGHTGGRRLLSPLRQPRPQIYNMLLVPTGRLSSASMMPKLQAPYFSIPKNDGKIREFIWQQNPLGIMCTNSCSSFKAKSQHQYSK